MVIMSECMHKHPTAKPSIFSIIVRLFIFEVDFIIMYIHYNNVFNNNVNNVNTLI